ncbi:PKD domain-containing protein [uncultured Jatrophihabitans sp.]|uniref:PKD domain-containing protein n=1 Tax=uncultured Jatrophihabitans sp. TaxID=1610747 RepID=UPI0035C9BF03
MSRTPAPRSARSATRTAAGRLMASVLAVGALVAAALAVPGAAQADGPTTTTRYAVNRPVCAAPKHADEYRCLALRRVTVRKGTQDAYRYSPSANGGGPGGGITPAQLAAAYGYNANAHRTNQLVAIIDWYDDPAVLSDLNHFDAHYHLRRETRTSFRKVNQRGRTSPLPRRNRDSSGEIALDVEAVRGVCHTCRILLVEADGARDSQVAAAVNTAARMHATEISNSYGGPERRVGSATLNAYRHPGVVITASSGDDGWYDFDYANEGVRASGRPLYPASSPNVVAVGGTTLTLARNRRASETVWNGNGSADRSGAVGGRRGASGGGCSVLYAAPAWQRAYRGYSATGCRGKRLATDIAAVADPRTGYSVYDTYGSGGWVVDGGTSLAAPVVAAMYALAGGSGGSAFPAASLYVNGTHRASSLYDVTGGGNGFCGGASTASCEQQTASYTRNATNNPNALGAGRVDCSFTSGAAHLTSAPGLSHQCNAARGFDGPTGLGSPAHGSAFTHTNPSVSMTHAKARHKHSTRFTAHSRALIAGSRAAYFVWHWGDGHTTVTRSARAHHRYARTGKRTVTLTVGDTLHQVVIKTYRVTVR